MSHITTRNVVRPHKRKVTLVWILSPAVFGCWISLFYGRIGLMPLDQSIIFDGGWRILSGQVPYRDFVTPNGLVPLLLQALFFKLLGVNWFAYCLHAAVFNAAFCVTVFFFLLLLGASRPLAAFYSALCGLFLYPPIGTPYMEQHSFVFLSIALLVGLKVRTTIHHRQRFFLCLLLPVLMMLSFLSKQIPAAPGAAVLLVLLWDELRQRPGALFAALATGSFFCFVVLISPIIYYRMDPSIIALYFFKIPFSLGRSRLLLLLSPAFVPNFFGVISPLVTLGSIFLVQLSVLTTLWIASVGLLRRASVRPQLSVVLKFLPLLAALTFFAVFPSWVKQHATGTAIRWYFFCIAPFALGLLVPTRVFERLGTFLTSRLRGITVYKILLLEALWILCVIFMRLTWNIKEKGMPYAFLCVGIFHIAVIEIFQGVWNNRIRNTAGVLAASILVCVSIRDAVTFHSKINVAKPIFTYDISPTTSRSQESLVPELSSLVWRLPPLYDCSAAEFSRLVDFLKGHTVNFYLFGDFSILYGLARKPSVSPSLYFDHTQCIPARGTKDFITYQKWIIDNINKYGVCFLLAENEEIGTWNGLRLADFDMLSHLFTRARPLGTICSFRIYDLCGMSD